MEVEEGTVYVLGGYFGEQLGEMFCWTEFVSLDFSLAGLGSSHGDQKERA